MILNMDKTIKWFFIILGIAYVVVATILILGNSNSKKQLPQEFQYSSHEYIYFPDKGVVHSPDCKQCQLVLD